MKKILFVLAAILFILPFGSVLAITGDNDADTGGTTGSTAGTVNLINPLGGTEGKPQGEVKNPQVLISKVIDAMLGVVGSLALLMFVYGGFLWMTSAGNTKQIDKGKDILTWAALGLVLIFTSYGLVKFVIKEVIGA